MSRTIDTLLGLKQLEISVQFNNVTYPEDIVQRAS